MEIENTIRLTVFLSLFALFALLERVAPKVLPVHSKKRRWVTNFSITILNTFLLRALAIGLPFLAVGAAVDSAQMEMGIFNFLIWPTWIEVVLAILLLDLVIWVQHLITHKVPFLWRLHRVHHSDVEFDVSTAIRFHPVEIAFSMLLKIGAVYLIGPAVLAVILFEISLNALAMFNHANIAVPKSLDKLLRFVIVTPDMHRVHHSINQEEHDWNYGFALSLWDRLFGTYSCGGQTDITVGLEWQDTRPTKLRWSLWLPFIRK